MSTLARVLPVRRAAFRQRTRPPAALWLPALAVAMLCAVPAVYLGWRVFDGAEAARAVLRDPDTARLLVRSLALAAAVTALATALALPVAWVTVGTDLPARRQLAVLAALPLAIPSYIGAMVMIAALGPGGLVEEETGWRVPFSVYGFGGSTVVLALFTYPYLLLTLRPAIAALDPRLGELSASFGYGRWTTARRVVLPQLRPSLASGGLLVALYTLSDFGSVALLRMDTFTRAIFIRYQSAFDRSGAAALALLLAVVALTVVALEVWSRGRTRYDSAHGGPRRSTPRPLGRWRWPAFAAVVGLLICSLGVPVAVLGYWLWRGIEAGEAVGHSWSAVRDSLTAAGLAAGATVVAALPVAVIATRYRAWLPGRVLEVLSYLGYALPGLVVALALVFTALRVGSLYQTTALLVAGYVLLFLPQAVGATRNALLHVRPSMEEAARGLGRSRWRVAATITAPLTARGLLAGGALVFLTTMKELPATLLLAPTGFQPLAVQVWSTSSEAFFARAALPALLLIALSALPLAVWSAWRDDG